MFKKKYEDEMRDIPEGLKFLILVAVIAAMFIGINLVCDHMDKVDMRIQNPEELVIVE